MGPKRVFRGARGQPLNDRVNRRQPAKLVDIPLNNKLGWWPKNQRVKLLPLFPMICIDAF